MTEDGPFLCSWGCMGWRDCLPWGRRTWGDAGGASPVHLNAKPEEYVKVWHCTPVELTGWFFLSLSSLILETPQTFITSPPTVSWDLQEDSAVENDVDWLRAIALCISVLYILLPLLLHFSFSILWNHLPLNSLEISAQEFYLFPDSLPHPTAAEWVAVCGV